MSMMDIDAGSEGHEIDRVRLRTLIALRWLAIAGQIIAVAVASFVLDLDLRQDLCALAIAASIAFNIIAFTRFPANKRLSETGVMQTLLFDISQLVFLLFLTGGLSNPFSILVLAPVTISATTLSLSRMLVVGCGAILAISVLAFFYLPLSFNSGEMIEPPNILVFGSWVALVIGILFLGGYAKRVADDNQAMSLALSATQMALSREQQLTALGGVVAAAAHELGTPLATIKLVSSELEDELADRSDLLEDVRLIRSQSERCRDILKDMGRSGRDDILTRHAPLGQVIIEAAEPHMNRGKEVSVWTNGQKGDAGASEQPLIPRHPEIIHGLRNLVQNAVDFSRSRVWIDVTWDDEKIEIKVSDDGIGFPIDLLGRIGDPFLRKRRSPQNRTRRRPNYEGMGLGVFIAKTLLERTGAQMRFSNGFPRPTAAETVEGRDLSTGAVVTVRWETSHLVPKTDPTREPLGENIQNRP